MKKIILFILASIFVVVGNFSYARISLLHGTATGDDVTMDFDDNYSSVGLDISSFTDNVCNTGKSGFLLTWQVLREGNGYVYFAEDDWDNTVSSCSCFVIIS